MGEPRISVARACACASKWRCRPESVALMAPYAPANSLQRTRQGGNVGARTHQLNQAPQSPPLLRPG
eukprot:365303-Chlamydomonas_euryale.AAC.45